MRIPSTRSTLRLALTALLLSACAEEPQPLLAPEALLRDGAPAMSGWSPAMPLAEPNTDSATDGCPFLTKSGKTLYFASTRPGGHGKLDIYVSHWDDAAKTWGEATNLGAAINTSGDEACAVVLNSGNEMIFYSDRAGGAGTFDLWSASRRDDRNDLGWESPVNLTPVNTIAYEFGHGAYEEEDGSTVLYFNSNRPGAALHDVYMSTRPKGGTFSAPTRVAELSSLAEDRFVRPRQDGLEIFFASDRPGTLGGLDLWSASRERTSDPWGAPVNLGPNVNSAAVDAVPAISWDGKTLLFPSNRSDDLDPLADLDLYQSTRSPGNGTTK